MKQSLPHFAFFGSPDLSVRVLAILKEHGFIPRVVITKPDAPVGRKQILTAPPVKVWAEEHALPVLQPSVLDSSFLAELSSYMCSFAIVAVYGKIIPKSVLDIFPQGTLNIHPSLLPLYRGASPVESAILADENVNGVTLMLMDEKMDHGRVIAQEVVPITPWPPKGSVMKNLLVDTGAHMLAGIIPLWISGECKTVEQDHTKATVCKKISKEDGYLELTPREQAGTPEAQERDYKNFLKIQAYDEWPRTYFIEKGSRVIIADAHLEDGNLVITRVIPEGKKEMDYSVYRKTVSA